MQKVHGNKRVIAKISTVFIAVSLALISVFVAAATSASSPFGFFSSGSANVGQTRTSGRVTPYELMTRYPVEWVLGPLDVNADGSYKSSNYLTDSEGNYVDENGEPAIERVLTNNEHNIPASKYFNVENYIHAVANNDDIGGGKKGRTLYGWRPNIWGVKYDPNNRALAVGTGYIINKNLVNGPEVTDMSSTQVGMYCNFKSSSLGKQENLYGTNQKYAMIVPDDITRVGQGNGGYVEGNATYYCTTDSGWNSTSTAKKDFTDFGSFLITKEVQNLHSYQPRERLSGIYFTEYSKLKSIADSTSSTIDLMSVNRCPTTLSGKSAFARCDNLRFCILPNGIESIGNGAFAYCEQLVDANIPSTVNKLGDKAYIGCTSLLHITVPKLVGDNPVHGADIFSGCTKLKDVVDLTEHYTKSNYPNTIFSFSTSASSSSLYVFGGAPTEDSDGNPVLDDGNRGFLFCKNTNENNNVVFATVGGTNNKSYEANK